MSVLVHNWRTGSTGRKYDLGLPATLAQCRGRRKGFMASQRSDDEFALLPETAADLGLEPTAVPIVQRVGTEIRDDLHVSSLQWGTERPRVVFLHGRGQNAHTWDSLILALGLPALAVDLPGHGHSSWRADGDYSPWTTADAVAHAVRRWAPDAETVVGASLGGLTTIRLTAIVPELVRRAIIVDVTPSAPQRHREMTGTERGATTLIQGPDSFDSFDEIVELAAAASPQRSRASIRRGVVHNTRQRPDGRWVWRYDRHDRGRDTTPLWEDLAGIQVPLTLIRGGASRFVTDADVDEVRRRNPAARILAVPGAGHSVHGDAPRELAELIGASLETV